MDRLYLKSWQYNCGKMLMEFDRILRKNGAKLCKSYNKGCMATNRTLTDAIGDLERRIERCYKTINLEPEKYLARKEYVSRLEQQLAELKSIPNEPILLKYTSWASGGYIGYVHNSDYYYIEFSDNPFFEPMYQKIRLNKNNKYFNRCYISNIKNLTIPDEMLSYRCSKETIRQMAEQTWDIMCNSSYSETYKERKRVQVKNIYDGGYHYETVEVPFKNKIELED